MCFGCACPVHSISTGQAATCDCHVATTQGHSFASLPNLRELRVHAKSTIHDASTVGGVIVTGMAGLPAGLQVLKVHHTVAVLLAKGPIMLTDAFILTAHSRSPAANCCRRSGHHHLI